MIERGGERRSGISVLMVRQDDDNDDDYAVRGRIVWQCYKSMGELIIIIMTCG